jgi:ribosome biogenesis GTPase A
VVSPRVNNDNKDNTAAARKEKLAVNAVIVGLDNAGKTTILNDLKGDGDEMVAPTNGLVGEITHVPFVVWSLLLIITCLAFATEHEWIGR